MSIEDTWTRLSRYAFLLEWLAERQVLEIGCGNGMGAALLADHAIRVVSGDPSREVVTRARRRATRSNLEFLVLDPLSPGGLDFPDGTFDLVSVPAAESWIREPGFLAEIRRLLSPTGFAYLATASADLPDATSGVGYFDLAAALGQAFPSVRLIAQSPGVHFTLTEFSPEGELDPSLDGSLLDDPDPCTHYVALCGHGELPRPGYSVVTVPRIALAEDPTPRAAADVVRLEARAAEAEARAELLDAELREERVRARQETPAPPAGDNATALREEISRLRAELESAQAAAKATQEEVAELQALRQAEAWSAEEAGGAARDEEALAALRDGAQRHEQEALRLRSELADLQALNQELESELDEAEQEKTQHAERLAQLTTHCDELERELGRRGMRIAELEGQIKGISLRGDSEHA